jgi:hypothetical protein
MHLRTAVQGGGTQVFRITGDPAQAMRVQAARGQRPTEQHLQVRGYVDTAQDTAVCGPQRAFVIKEVLTVY